MAYTPTPDPVIRALQEMHPDTFVQAAILRLYREAPGLLDAAPYVKIAAAEGLDPQQMLEARPTPTTPQED